MAGTKPTRPRPPPISPQAHENHEVPSTSSSKAPPKQPPPPKQMPIPKQTPTAPSSIISPNEQKALYASVKKPKRYPAPTMPAPPPPYEGDTVKRMASVESPTSPNPPPVSVAKEPSPTVVTKESGQGHPPVRSQPSLEETDGSGRSAKVTSKEGSGAAAPVAGRPRPPRPAPSRPSRPPAGTYADNIIQVHNIILNLVQA